MISHFLKKKNVNLKFDCIKEQTRLNSFENEEEEKLESQEVSECLPFRPDAS
jgi:hypothetical protein